MANIAPFRGLRYDSRAAGSMDLLIGPPYDLVKDADLERFHSRHQCNFIHLIYCQRTQEEPYLKAAHILKQWQSSGMMARDPEPAFYLYEIEFQMDPQGPVLSRTGFMALLRLQDYKLGMIRPHERTFTSVKSDRLDWLAHCQASLSQVLSFYDDPKQEVVAALSAAAPTEPDLEFSDLEGIRHRMWLVTGAEAQRQVARLMETKQIYIADGHHRYETCLAYRDLMRRTHPQAHPLASFNYTLIYAAAMQDPGLAILPAHRLMPGLANFHEESFLAGAAEFFEITDTGLSPDAMEDRNRFRTQLAGKMSQGTAIGIVSPAAATLKLLLPKREMLNSLQVHPALKDLDVVVLREIVMRRCLGLYPELLDDDKLIAYDYSLNSALDRVRTDEAPVGFLLNPTRVSQVKAVADAGLFMPRKSTIFYPKVSPGMAVCPLLPGELVDDPLFR